MGLGSILRTLRKSCKYSQQYVATCLNISRNAYMAWENGETQISYHKLQQICEIYQISLQELLIEVEKKSSTNTRKKRAKRKEVLLEYFS